MTVGGIISTVAGTGVAGATGDGGQATSAQLNSRSPWQSTGRATSTSPTSATIAVRKVRTGGAVITVAGTGTAGLLGSGGQATSAQLRNAPADVAVDAQGNFYIADWSNNRIRKVT